jgi:hypothetical protein
MVGYSRTVRDYFKRLVQGWVGRLSGPASIILGVLSAFWPRDDSGKRYLIIAAIVCFVVAQFAVWCEERKERLHLERAHGPQIYIEVIPPGPTKDTRESIKFSNLGDDVARNVHFEEVPDEPIKILMVPSRIPLISPNETYDVLASFAKNLSPYTSELRLLADHLSDDRRELSVYVVWESAQGVCFRRQVTFERPLMSDRVFCYSGIREVVKAAEESMQ